jgi:signal transduction histidine kinase
MRRVYCAHIRQFQQEDHGNQSISWLVVSGSTPMNSTDLATRDVAGLETEAPSAVQWSRLTRPLWILLVVAAVALMLVATPRLFNDYQSPCGDIICDYIAQPNPQTIDTLSRLRVPLDTYAATMVTADWVNALIWLALGGLIVWKRPHDTFGMLIAFGFVFTGANLHLRALDESNGFAEITARASMLIAYAAGPLIIALFPDGRWVPRWSRWIAAAGVSHAIVFVLAPRPRPAVMEAIESPLAVAIWGSLLAAQVYRYRHVSSFTQRQQTKWLLFGIGVLAVNQAVVAVTYALGVIDRYQLLIIALTYAATVVVVISIGNAVFRHRLFDIDIIINRTLVYAGLTLGVLGIYVLIVGGLGAIFQTRGYTASFLAAGAVAVAFQPFRMQLQRSVNRLVYGERDEPYTILGRLGERLEATPSPDTVLDTIVETIAGALKLPYVAISLGESEHPAAVTGTLDAPMTETVELVYQGETVGRLMAAPRHGEHSLSPSDRAVLRHLARQTGVAANGVRLMEDLRRSRERIISAREEERRRLRRDLHDGLGPQLASQTLTIDAAIRLLEEDPETAARLLAELKTQSADAVAEIRRLVYELRPPALDDLGLAGAIQALADSWRHTSIDVVVQTPAYLSHLPAAIEVAAYRIVQEALTNCIRHANGSRCDVVLAVDDFALRLEVRDNGQGMPVDLTPGIGLHSMHERATELGGTCHIERNETVGTRVTAWLPLPRENT